MPAKTNRISGCHPDSERSEGEASQSGDAKVKDEFGWPEEVKNIFPFLFAILAFNL